MTAAQLPQPAAVGVVMTAYNGAAYIEIALQSLIDQSWTDWECVVVDDGSTDDTAAIVTRLAAADDRLRLIRTERGGVSQARNTGLASLSHGVRYVALLDSDDEYLPDALQALVTALEQRPDAVGVYGFAEYMDENGRPIRPGEHPEFQNARRAVRSLGLTDVPPEDDTTFEDLTVAGAIWPSAVGLHRREIIDAVGGFDPSFTRQGDWELYLRMSRHGPFPVLQQQVVWYRRHGNNLTGDATETFYQQARVRVKTWRSPENDRAQRKLVVRAARLLHLAGARRLSRRFVRHVRSRELRAAAQDLFDLGLVAGTLPRPGPPRPSRRAVQWIPREQSESSGSR
jgi:glycosyltransferase involved in cell wall biosynthesis